MESETRTEIEKVNNEENALHNDTPVKSEPETNTEIAPNIETAQPSEPGEAEAKSEPSVGSETVSNNNVKNETAGRPVSSSQKQPESNAEEFKPMQRVIRANLITLRENPKSGWKRLVTITQWGGGRFKLDIREWNKEMTRSTKGMTFTRSETIMLRNLLDVINMEMIDDYIPPVPSAMESEADKTVLKAG